MGVPPVIHGQDAHATFLTALAFPASKPCNSYQDTATRTSLKPRNSCWAGRNRSRGAVAQACNVTSLRSSRSSGIRVT